MKLSLLAGTALVALALAAPVAQPPKDTLRLHKKGLQWDYANDKIRGVNLGGWFVLEPYITPSIFEIWLHPGDDLQVPVDEYHYSQKLGKKVAKQRLLTHWDTWYSEDDFEQIADAGLNFVRIPIGYWAFQMLDDDPYVDGQQYYLDRALGWAQKHGLKVWIDLHGAPGSQNGFDNSGLRDSVDFQQGVNAQVALAVLQQISNKYGGLDYEDVVIGIELLNEPLGPSLDMGQLKDFFTTGYNNLRRIGSVQAAVIQDAFQTPGYWDLFLPASDPNSWNVVIDHHHYQVFSADELGASFDDKIETVCGWGKSALLEGHWNVAGEWSAALTDCAHWLNGVGRGARWSGDYDNSPNFGSCLSYLDVSNWSLKYREQVRRFIEAQLDAYEQTGGWVFWNWKCEDAIEWDFKRLTAAGVFPQPLDSRTYPNQCNF